MNWKTDLKLADIDRATRIEITCKSCRQTHYKTAGEMLSINGMRHAYMDEVEAALCCSLRACKGRVRIALVHDGKMEGFVGGMA